MSLLFRKRQNTYKIPPFFVKYTLHVYFFFCLLFFEKKNQFFIQYP